MFLENIGFIKNQYRKPDKEIEKQLNAFSHTLQTVSYIDYVIVAGIIAEIGDIYIFSNKAAFSKFTGLVLNKDQSGNFNVEDNYLDKCGNFYSRYYLIEFTNLFGMHVDAYKAIYYTRKLTSISIR